MTITKWASNPLFMTAGFAIVAALIVSRVYTYLVGRWKLSVYPLYEDETVTPIEDLHGSRDLIAKGFNRFRVSHTSIRITPA